MSDEGKKKKFAPLWSGLPTTAGSAAGGCARCQDIKKAFSELSPSASMPSCDSCQPDMDTRPQQNVGASVND